MDGFLKLNNLKLSSESYWFFLDQSDDRYQIFENEMFKLLDYDKKDISLKELQTLLSKNDNEQTDRLFFSILASQKEIVFLTQNYIRSVSDVYLLIQKSKFYFDILLKSKDNFDLENNIPKYMFRERKLFVSLFTKLNTKKFLDIINLLKKTELLLRKNNDIYLIISQRFLLNLKKNID